MQWHIFTFSVNKSGKQGYNDWLETLLNGLQAENFIVIDKTTIGIYHQQSKNDEFDKFGLKI